jgi:hypothetical protein
VRHGLLLDGGSVLGCRRTALGSIILALQPVRGVERDLDWLKALAAQQRIHRRPAAARSDILRCRAAYKRKRQPRVGCRHLVRARINERDALCAQRTKENVLALGATGR